MAVCFEQLDDEIFLLVIGRDDPTDAEWNAWLAFVAARPVRPRARVIVHSAGGGPDATQRSALAGTMKERPKTRVAVLVDSAVGRGIVTALGWLYGNFTAFDTPDIAGALSYLDLAPTWAPAVRRRIAALVASARDAP
jgi:hypothetical protein